MRPRLWDARNARANAPNAAVQTHHLPRRTAVPAMALAALQRGVSRWHSSSCRHVSHNLATARRDTFRARSTAARPMPMAPRDHADVRVGYQPHAAGDHGCALLVHGGAWDIPADETGAHEEGMRMALARGRELLLGGASALEAAVETVAVMEWHEAFDAGIGSVLNEDGVVELDAGAMDGTSRAVGSVIGVRNFVHPIRIAHHIIKVARNDFRVLAGDGAEAFARQQGMEPCDPDALIVDRERRRYAMLLEKRKQKDGHHSSYAFLRGGSDGNTRATVGSGGELAQEPQHPKGTVGCVARDQFGCVAAATSTGGTPFKVAGRVGDCPLPGGGFYASSEASCSATGWGEAIATALTSARAVEVAGTGNGTEAAMRESVERVVSELHAGVVNPRGQGATGGVIVMHADGSAAFAYSTPRMARGGWAEGRDAELWVALDDP